MSRNISLVTAAFLTCLATAGLFFGCAAPVAEPPNGSDTTPGGGNDAVPGVLQIRAFTESLGEAAKFAAGPGEPSDGVDVNLTPTEYTVAFKRIVLKQVDEDTDETLAQIEVFDADAPDDALVVDLLNSMASDVQDLSAGRLAPTTACRITRQHGTSMWATTISRKSFSRIIASSFSM